MRSTRWFIGLAIAIGLLASAVSYAQSTELFAVQFPERQTVALEFGRVAPAPVATLKAEVTFRDKQSRIELTFKGMRPAVLYGGDVTSYVVWAVGPDGNYENLGELWVGTNNGKVSYTTGFKFFGLMITAEPYYLVDRPSALVLFRSLAPKKRSLQSRSFAYSDFAPATKFAVENITDYRYSGSMPLDVLQAKRTYELAQQMGVERFAAETLVEAQVALGQATNLAAKSSLSREMVDYARRSVTLSSQAMRKTAQTLEQQRLDAEARARQTELDQLADRATGAEAARLSAEQQSAALAARIAEAEATLRGLQAERVSLADELLGLSEDKSRLDAELGSLQAQKAELEQRLGALEQERAKLSSRLEGALSQVAETRNSARGIILNLPDILFDLNQSTLKPETRITLAKLTGILSLMSELNLRVEGHTDSTGSAEYNQRLSEKRALAVVEFLNAQGVGGERMQSAGYGKERPIADNATAEGRARNRRVEIILAEGAIPELAAGSVP